MADNRIEQPSGTVWEFDTEDILTFTHSFNPGRDIGWHLPQEGDSFTFCVTIKDLRDNRWHESGGESESEKEKPPPEV